MTTSLLTVFILSLTGAWFGKSVPSLGYTVWGTRKASVIGLFITGFVMIAFSGLRRTIGDTYYYIHAFQLAEQAGNPEPVIGGDNFLFDVLQYSIRAAGGKAETFVMITAIMTLVPALLTFRKYAPDFLMAIFFYFTTGTYFITMNGIRQFVATGIILMATKYLFSPKKTDFLKFMFFVVVAYFFHTSALVLIPMYFVCRRKAWSPSTFMIIIAGIAVLIFVSLFFPSFSNMLEDSSFSQYSDGWFTEGAEGGTNILRLAFHSIPMVLSAVYYKELRKYGPVTDVLVNLSVIHFAIFLISLYNWIFARFAFYTYTYMALLLSLIFSTVLKDSRKTSVKFVLYIIFMFFFFRDAAGADAYRSDYFTPNNNVWFSFIY